MTMPLPDSGLAWFPREPTWEEIEEEQYYTYYEPDKKDAFNRVRTSNPNDIFSTASIKPEYTLPGSRSRFFRYLYKEAAEKGEPGFSFSNDPNTGIYNPCSERTIKI